MGRTMMTRRKDTPTGGRRCEPVSQDDFAEADVSPEWAMEMGVAHGESDPYVTDRGSATAL